VDSYGEFHLNTTVVKDLQIEYDDDGNKTYTYTLHEDLFWSNGSQMTARDYVGAVLWDASPQWVEVGASSPTGDSLLGHTDYQSGESEYFAGVSLISDFVFSLTIDADELPFFYEFSLAMVDPKYMATYAPGVEIISDENGSKFSEDILDHAQRISETERFAPTVVAGPYTFVSFDNEIVTLQRNPNFKGDAQGRKPTIEFIVQKSVPDATTVEMLFSGDVNLLPEEIMGARIERVKAEEGFTVTSFLRNGYGVMNLVCDWGPTADRNVRWAIACLIDRHQLLDQVLDGYGGLVDTEAGEAQWMYQAKRAELQEALIPIALNIARANEFLDQTDWVFEADGTTPFDSSLANAEGTYMRHNSAGEMLTINHGAANADIGAVIELEFLKNTPLAGINYTFQFLEWGAVLDNFYFASELPDDERHFSSFSMGTGFGSVFDPYWSWHSDHLGTWVNANQLNDPELDDLIMKMRRTPPGDNAAYLAAWFDYVVRWNYILPAIPLYSNEYFDLYSNDVRNVNTNPFNSWYQIICEITVG
jgi:peptide/nickel transport system substrate-binding protein